MTLSLVVTCSCGEELAIPDVHLSGVATRAATIMTKRSLDVYAIAAIEAHRVALRAETTRATP